MTFTFLTATGEFAFFRSDAMQARWMQEEMSLNCTFPYDPKKTLERGMTVLFQDPATNDWQAYEIRNCTTIFSDNTQQITAEDIAISELTDCHIRTKLEITGQTAASVLSQILSGTGWAIGRNEDSGTSYADIQRGSVWDGVITIRNNWNIYIMPRVSVNSSGITGKYLDILPSGGVWRGVRIALEKNCSDPCVTYDDSELYTALYGYGASKTVGSGSERTTQETTFAGVTWSKTADHPAKPAGQTYLEYPEMTALYGRKGKARFGYYQNTSIDDPALLLKKTWEMLKTCCQPKISITGTVVELKRLGYSDQPIRLHDKAIVDLGGIQLYKQIIQLTVDLLDPSKNTLNIGDYIPNIIYIGRRTEQYATGGSAGYSSGLGGAYNSTYAASAFDYQRESIDQAESNIDDLFMSVEDVTEDLDEVSEDLDETKERVEKTEEDVTVVEQNLSIVKRDTDRNGQVIRAAGMDIDSSGVVIYAMDVPNGIGVNFKVQNDRITSEVEQRQNDIAVANTRITQTANKIELEATERKAEGAVLSSRLTVAANAITAEVNRATAEEGFLSGRITVNADKITAEVTRAQTEEGKLAGRLTVTESAITAEVTRATGAEGTLSGRITVNANAITAEVTRASDAESALSGRITVNADAITAEVTRATGAEGTLSGRITTNADNITAEVTRAQNAENGLSGRITVNADKVALVVSETSGGYEVNSASIVAGINGQTGSYVKISADTINLSGYVTASELYATDAKIDNLTSGATTANTLKAYLISASTGFNYQGQSISFKTVTIGGTTYHLMGY